MVESANPSRSAHGAIGRTHETVACGLRTWLPSVALGILVMSCNNSTSPSDTEALATLTAEGAAAVTQPVVSDLFRMAVRVANGLASGSRGCTWRFDLQRTAYVPSDCGQAIDRIATYVISLPDLPHQGVTLPIDLPLVGSGEMRFPTNQCGTGFELADLQRQLLIVCPMGGAVSPDGWHSSLLAAAGVWRIEATHAQLQLPSPRTRYTLQLEPPASGSVFLQHDVLEGVERAESRLEATREGTTLQLSGFSGATGPDYTATRNGRAFGRIYWAGKFGFKLENPGGAPLSPVEEQLLRDARLLLAALGRMAEGTHLLLDQVGSGTLSEFAPPLHRTQPPSAALTRRLSRIH